MTFPAPFRFEDPRQERIYRRLRGLVGHGPADFFKDACQLMANPASLATTSHLVSHCLREVESAFCDVLKTLSEHEARLKVKTSDNGHEKKIRGILRDLQISDSDPIAVAWLGLVRKDNGYGLARRAHRYALFARPVDGAFRQFWNEMQGILDVVLDKFDTSYLAVYTFLDQLLGKAVPTQADLDKLKNNVPNNIVAHGYFFDRLTSPSWLDFLQSNGLFSYPPAPEVDSEKGTIGYSVWPPSQYLVRMAPLAPEKVLNIMLAVPPTDNFRVYEDFASAAAVMPPELAAKWSEEEAERVSKLESLFGLLPGKLSKLMNYLLQSGRVVAAFSIARSLLDVLPDLRSEKQKQNKDEYSLPPEPRARVSAWEYKRILERMIPLLSPAARMPAFDLFCDFLEKAITLSKNSSEDDPEAEDFSYIWHPNLEDKPRGDHLKNILVSAVCEVAHAIVAHDPIQLPVLVERLEKRCYEIFHRIALDLLRRYPDNGVPLIAARLTDRCLFDARGTQREYELLAVECFGKLKLEDQQKILGWIEAGPGDDDTYKQWHKERSGQEPSVEEVAQRKKRWQRIHLTPLHKSLPTDWRERYEVLIGEVGQPKGDVTENAHVEVWRGPTSPMTAAGFQSMNVQEIVTYLRSWQPSHAPMSPSREGLCRQLTETIHKDPTRFAPEAARFLELDPTYVRGFLQGIRQAANGTVALPWSEIISLCHWVVRQPIAIEGRQVEKWGDDHDWGWTRKAIAGLLGAGLQEGLSMIPFELRGQVWNILEILTTDPDPTPEDEARDGPIDPPHIAINSTRGEAMQVVVRYALWVRSFLEEVPDGAEKVARSFREMTEVRRVLEAHLDLAQDPSLAIRSVYGRWFPSLTYLDVEWTKDHVQAIFPRQDGLLRYRDAAWDTYLYYCWPDEIVFDLLREEYKNAVLQLSTPSTTSLAPHSTSNLVQHFMVFYWQGKLPLDDKAGLLALFYEKATDALLGEALEFVGQSLSRQGEPLPEEVSVRLKILWENRLATIKAAPTPADHIAELSAFGWWFASRKFDDAWAISQLHTALSLIHTTAPDYHVVEQLVVLAPTFPLEAVQCLALMVEGDREGWEIRTWRDDSRKILMTVLSSSNSAATQAAIELVNRLAARGMPDYKDLIDD